MGLFSTLQATQPSSSSAKSLELPTVVQLFSETPLQLVDVAHGSGSGGGGLMQSWPKPWKVLSMCQVPTWACLSYQTVQTFESTSSHSSKVDLGVWNVRVARAPQLLQQQSSPPSVSQQQQQQQQPRTAVTDALLKIPSQECGKFCFTVNLSQPSKVESRLTHMQEALVRFLITTGVQNKKAAPTATTEDPEMETDGDDKPATTAEDEMFSTLNETTTLYQLRSVQFGLAPNDKPTSTPTAEEADKQVKVALVICAILPSSNKTKSKDAASGAGANADGSSTAPAANEPDEDEGEDYYQAKQTQELLLYHLRKYAMLLNCSLVFVNNTNGPEGTAAAAAAAPTSLTLSQTSLILRAFGCGQAIWNDYESILELETTTTTGAAAGGASATAEATAEETADATEQEQVVTPLVFGPGSYQQDLLDSVLLRNAQFPGHWDAAKESIWAILPDEEALEEHHRSSVGKQAKSGSKSGAMPLGAGDQAWLTELRDSIDSPAITGAGETPGSPDPTQLLKTPEPKNNKHPNKDGKGGKSTAKKTTDPNTPATANKASSKDTAAFFESLLKS